MVAPAVLITTAYGDAAGPDGTSYAAPQVAGLVALLIQRNSQLQIWPEGVKAILMASAVHNIEGDRRLSEYDGTGAIDAPLADQIAQTQQAIETDPCNFPCWWGVVTGSSTPGVGGTLNRYFNAIRGERIRVAISWMSNADSEANNYSFDRLDTNFDLRIFTAGNTEITSSTTIKNNYEIVEFVAPATTTYRIAVKKEAATESTNSIGIAWTKQATYLPDIRRDAAEWQSTLFVRNEDPTDQQTQITWCRHIGSPSVNCDLGANPTIGGGDVFNTTATFANVQDSGTVDGSESLSVISRIFNNGSLLETLDNGYRTSPGDPAFEQSGTTLYIPAFYKNVFSANSQVYIQNKGASAATLQVEFIGRTGYSNYTVNPGSTIPSNGVWYAVGSSIAPSSWVGSLKITSDQPIIAKTYETVPNMARSFNGTAIGNKVLYVPAAYKNYGGFTTGLIIQNLGGSATNIQLTFCFQPTDPFDAAQCPIDSSITNLQPNQAAGINLASINLPPVVDGWRGSIKIQSVANQPLAAVVNNVRKDGAGNTIGGYSFNASNYGGRLVVLPYAARNSGGRTTGFTLRNVHTAAVDVTVRYYNTDGTLRWLRPTFTLQRAWSQGFYQNSGDDAIYLSDPWDGSIVLQATGPILVVMREDKTSGDQVSGYNGIVLSQ